MVKLGILRKQRTVLEYAKAKLSKIQRGKIWIQRADEIFVEPLCLFHLKAYPFDGIELFVREVDDESYAKVIEPCFSTR